MNNLACRSTESHAGSGLTTPDAGIAEAVPVQTAGETARGPADADREQAQLMLAYGIRQEGRRYCFGSYCSLRLQDAVACARLAARRTLYTSSRVREAG